MTDFSKMSDQELLAYIHTDQPGNGPAPADSAVAPVAPPKPVDVTPLPPLAPAKPEGQTALQATGSGVNSFAEGIPVIGGLLKNADAATDATIAPGLESFARKSSPMIQALMGYDPKAEIGNLPTWRQRYDASLNLQRFRGDQFHNEHPVADTGLRIGGGVAGTVAMLPVLAAGTAAAGPEAGLLARSGIGALEGGGVGGADGYTRGNGGFDDPSRLRGAEGGAVFGGLGGAALPVASKVAKVAFDASAGKLINALRGERVVQAPDEDAAAALTQALREHENPGVTGMEPPPTAARGPSQPVPAQAPSAPQPPQDRLGMEAALISAKREPLKVNASNLDDAYIRIARALQRQEMTPEAAAEASQKIGPLGVLADTGEATRDLLRAAMNRPGPGGTIAAENLRPRQAGVFDPENGSYLARPSSVRITDQAKTGLGLDGKDFHTEDEALIANRKAAADPAYDAMRGHAPVATSALADFAGSPVFSHAYDDARTIAAKTFVKLPDGTEKIVPLPAKMPDQLDWRTLDLMKQAMDDTISTSAQQGIGATSRGASKGYLQRFVSKLDSLNPDYAPAREAFAGPTAMRDALQEGRGLLNEDVPTLAANIAGRPESERQMLRLGAYQALQTKLGNANVTFDAANQAGLLKPNQLARFRALFPDQKSFADFYKTMENEKAMYATNQAAFGNSSTAKQLLNVNEASDPLLEGVSRIAESAPEGNIMGLIKGIHQLGQESPMKENTAASIVSVLSRHYGPDEMAQVLKRINDAKRAAAMADLVRESNGAAAGTVAAQTVQRDQ